jgi:hypothetical protein
LEPYDLYGVEDFPLHAADPSRSPAGAPQHGWHRADVLVRHRRAASRGDDQVVMRMIRGEISATPTWISLGAVSGNP